MSVLGWALQLPQSGSQWETTSARVLWASSMGWLQLWVM